jgi:hypothetical protein
MVPKGDELAVMNPPGSAQDYGGMDSGSAVDRQDSGPRVSASGQNGPEGFTLVQVFPTQYLIVTPISSTCLGVARDVGRAMTHYTVVVDKSTVPVGTARKVRETIARETGQPFSVVSNPEFLKQGAAIEDFTR